MEFKDIVATRRSVRKFSDEAIPASLIEQILEVAKQAPSSKNSRSTLFMVESRREVLERIATMRDSGSTFVKDAPAVILVMGDRTKTDLWDINCAISTTMLQLAITDAGLGSCWVHVDKRPQKRDEPDGAQAEDLLRELLPIPEECSVLCLVALGKEMCLK